MQEHQLFLNLGDNNQMVARCGCGSWQQERPVKMSQSPSEVVRELEELFEEHIGQEAAVYVRLPAID
jgi:hypothetical protein